MTPQSVTKKGIIIFENGLLTIKNGDDESSFQTTNFFSIRHFGRVKKIDPIRVEDISKFNGQKKEVVFVPIPQSLRWGDNNRKKPYPYNVYIKI